MTMLEYIERLIGWTGGALALAVLSAIFAGIARGLRSAPGRTTGRMPGIMHSPLFFTLSSAVYFGLGYLAWRPFPFSLSTPARILAVTIGAFLTLGGLGLVLWGRLALGKMYFVSYSMGAQLFTGHRLVKEGPYRLVRHPMYLGILMTGLGGIFLYQTWTMVLILLTGMGLILRARREEQVLAAEFGQDWQDYCSQTPGFLPLFRTKRK